MKRYLYLLVALGMFAALVVSGCGDILGGDDKNVSSGKNSVVVKKAAFTGEQNGCKNGGISVEAGIDENGDGLLNATEVDSTQYVCNGENGAVGATGDQGIQGLKGDNGDQGIQGIQGDQGIQGIQGDQGDQGDSVTVELSTEPTGTNCANGGTKVTVKAGGVEVSHDYVCNGSVGDTGPAGPVTTTNESCAVCHGASRTADVADKHPAPAEELIVSVTTVTNPGDDLLEISFSLTDGDGNGVTGVGSNKTAFYISDIVPAGTAAGAGTAWESTWDTDYLERWVQEQEGAGYDGSTYPFGTWTEVGDGAYTYAFATALSSTAALAEAPDYNAAHVQRLVIKVDGRAAGYTRTVGIQDFMVDGTLLAPQRVLAPIDGCKKCHSSEMDKAAHASGYSDTRACAMCHSPLGHYGERMQTDGAWLANLIHKVHAEIPMEAFADRIGGGGYGAVTYPQDIRNCETCHTGNGGMTDAWKSHPTAEACGSCHTDVNFADGTGHGGGTQANNNNCATCHPATGTLSSKSVTEAHDTTLTGNSAPEFDVTITMTAPTGTYYVAGEAPIVTVTLTNHDGGTAVDPAIYTTDKAAKGVTGGGLSAANLYVYGPRAKAVPVLTTDSTTDPDSERATPLQGHSLLLVGGENSDPAVSADSSGFHYQLSAIPEDMAAGTYMVRFEGADYGGPEVDDFVTSSTAVINFQVGTATPEKKVAGDSCLDCHGDSRMHLTGKHAHNAAFDTDHCLGCHDQSGNYAIPIANRVHAVHSASEHGDLYSTGRDFSEITYPQNTIRCVTCHSSGKTTYKTAPATAPCMGCHGDSAGAIDHFTQNGGLGTAASH